MTPETQAYIERKFGNMDADELREVIHQMREKNKGWLSSKDGSWELQMELDGYYYCLKRLREIENAE